MSLSSKIIGIVTGAVPFGIGVVLLLGDRKDVESTLSLISVAITSMGFGLLLIAIKDFNTPSDKS